MLPVPDRLRATLLGALLAGLLVTGCSDGVEDAAAGASPDDGATTSASPEPTGPTRSSEPAPSGGSGSTDSSAPPRLEDTPAGRRAFAELVVERWGEALRTNDAAALTSLAPRGRSCLGCPQLRDELAERRRQGWSVDFPGARVDRVQLVRDSAFPGVVAVARVDIPASRSSFDDGRFRNDNRAHPDASFTVAMQWHRGGFELLGFELVA